MIQIEIDEICDPSIRAIPMAITWTLLISVFQSGGGGVILSTSTLQEKGALCGPTKSICATKNPAWLCVVLWEVA